MNTDVIKIVEDFDDFDDWQSRKIYFKDYHVGRLYVNHREKVLYLKKIDLKQHNLHRKGHGTEIINYIIESYRTRWEFNDEDIHTMHFFVVSSNKSADKFYEKLGFTKYKDLPEDEQLTEFYHMIDQFDDPSEMYYQELFLD